MRFPGNKSADRFSEDLRTKDVTQSCMLIIGILISVIAMIPARSNTNGISPHFGKNLLIRFQMSNTAMDNLLPLLVFDLTFYAPYPVL
jgi:hypothetical protein